MEILHGYHRIEAQQSIACTAGRYLDTSARPAVSPSGADELVCGSGHRYAVVEGIPILPVSEAEPTHIEGTRALVLAETGDFSSLPQFNIAPGEIDPFVRNTIGATNGGFYQHLVGKSIPSRICACRRARASSLVEVGCNWGSWCLAAAVADYQPVGIDPSLMGIRAAKRVAQQLGVEAFVVGDSRFLAFCDGVIDQAFSYSVLQHLSKEVLGRHENAKFAIGRHANCSGRSPTTELSVDGYFSLMCRPAIFICGRRAPERGANFREAAQTEAAPCPRF